MSVAEKDAGKRGETTLTRVEPVEPVSPAAETAKPMVLNEQTNYVPKRRIIIIFLACSTVELVALLDQTTLAAALPVVAEQLNAGAQRAWIAGGFFVTSTCFQLVYGRFSDIWSRKATLLVGFAVFFIGSLLSSEAQTATQLIAFRALTGTAGGGLMSVAQMIVSDVVPLRERGKYQGILGSVVAISNGIGPIIGGSLAQRSNGGWRWIFRLNLFLTVFSSACVVFFMPLKKVTGDWKLKVKLTDWVGVLLSLAGTSVFTLGLTWGGGEYAWNSLHVILTLVLGFLGCTAFVLWQWKGARMPLVPLHIFKSRIVNGACLTMAINGWNFVVQVYYIPTFYQLVYGYSPVRSGALLLPITLFQTACSTASGLVVHWTGRYRECILLGWVLWAVGLGLFSTLDEHSGLGKQVGYAILTGVGVGNTLQPALIAIQAGVERRDMAVVTAFRNFIRNLGATFGLAVSGTIINNIVSRSLSNFGLSASAAKAILDSPQVYLANLPTEQRDQIRAELISAYRSGFRIIFIVMAALAALSFVLAAGLIPQISLNRADDEALKKKALEEIEAEKERERERRQKRADSEETDVEKAATA